jgi:hypothetical protein
MNHMRTIGLRKISDTSSRDVQGLPGQTIVDAARLLDMFFAALPGRLCRQNRSPNNERAKS